MIPKRLELENFLSYDKAELDFDFSSALIVGENGSGKSSILESIAWCLYGKSRFKHADEIVKRGRKVAKVTLYFEHDKRTYKIIRKRNSKYASQNSLELYEIVGGKEEQIKQDTNSQLDAKIREITKSNYDVFINSSYFRQGTVSEFLYGTSSKRQKIVSSILNLDRWDNYMEAANKKYKELDKELALIKYKLSELQNVEEQIGVCESDIESKQERADDLNRREELLAESIRATEFKISNLKTKDQNLHDYQQKKSNYEYACNKIQELQSARENKSKIVDSASREREVNQRAILEIDKQVENLLPNLELKDKVTDISEKEGKLHILKVDLNRFQKQIQNLKDSDECLACGNIHSDPVKKQAEIDRIEVKANEIALRINKGNRVVKKLKEYANTVRQTELEIDKYTSRKRNIENNISLHDLKIESAHNEIALIDKSIAEYTKQRDSLQAIIDEVQKIGENNDFKVLKDDLEKRKSERKSVCVERDELLYAIGSLKEKLSRLYADSARKEELASKLEELGRSATVYSSLVRGFGRNGIQSVIIDNVVEELTKVTNEQLMEFTSTPTYVEFITQKKDSKDSWKETLDVNIRTPSGISEFEGLSGGEGFRVAFSIRLALSYIQARRMGGETQLLMLDEVSTCLDPNGLELFVSIIRKLEKNIKIMVITHDDKLKEEFEHIIHVSKQGDDSYIES